MIKSGLVSITFRQLTPLEIVNMVKEAGLDGIEWGGDVHVPHGDIEKAKEVYQLTNDAGLDIPAYGSYYRVAESEQEGLLFQDVLSSAIELKTPVIRVWAGKKGSIDADPTYRQAIVDDSLRIASMAEKHSIKIAFEYHGGTLTDTNESAKQLIADTNHENILCYWQPPIRTSIDYRLEGLTQIVSSKLAHIHTFHWEYDDTAIIRKPLADGRDEWREYLKLANNIPGTHYAMLEFVTDDAPENFPADAAALKDIIQSIL